MTPEGKVKSDHANYLQMIGCVPASKAALATKAHKGYYFDPVPTGMGVAGIHDRQGHYKGRYFSIEYKAPGRRNEANRGMTAQQKHQYDAINFSGGLAMVYDGEEDDKAVFKAWVRSVDMMGEGFTRLRDRQDT